MGRGEKPREAEERKHRKQAWQEKGSVKPKCQKKRKREWKDLTKVGNSESRQRNRSSPEELSVPRNTYNRRSTIIIRLRLE